MPRSLAPLFSKLIITFRAHRPLVRHISSRRLHCLLKRAQNSLLEVGHLEENKLGLSGLDHPQNPRSPDSLFLID